MSLTTASEQLLSDFDKHPEAIDYSELSARLWLIERQAAPPPPALDVERLWEPYENHPEVGRCLVCGDDGVPRSDVEAFLAATPPTDAVTAFLDSIPDDGLPDRLGDHYRVVTVCGHCGEVWRNLFATPPTDEEKA